MKLDHRIQRHQGSALIVSMILLLALTMLGLSGTQTSTLELRMASNMADRAKAFQAAEHALQYAQDYVNKLAVSGEHKTLFGTTPGLYKTLNASAGQGGKTSCTTSTPWLNSQAKWTASDSIEIPANAYQPMLELSLHQKPRFMVGYDNEHNKGSPCYANTAPEGYSNSIGSIGKPLQTEKFTITVVGYGSQPNTRVRLQATFNALM
jgi:Tfp pilus assembly protein PilX